MISSAGRTWYSPQASVSCAATHYMGIYVPLRFMRRNARLLSDIADEQSALARHQLLRIFLRINYRLMQNAKFGSNARAVMEWDSESEHSLPTGFAIHVLYDPEDHSADFSGQAVQELTACAKDDKKKMHRQEVNRAHLLLRADMWTALCSTYEPGVIDGSDDFAIRAPPSVFTAELARANWKCGTFSSRHKAVVMSRTDLDVSIFFNKFCPWYQERQLPDIPIFCSDENGPGLCHLSRMLPENDAEETQSVWEQLINRAERARQNDGYCSWIREEVCHSLHGEQAGYVPPSERALNTHQSVPLDVIPYADQSLSPFATWVARFLMDAEAYCFLYKQHMLLLKLLLGSLDVAREAGNGQVHYSGILAGPNSTSKSYVFTLLEDLLIPGTVSRATRRTENSFTYCQDQGCRVLIDHEMPGDFFGDCASRKDGGARTSQTKEILTSHEANTESCQIVDGKRTMVTSQSRAHLCYLAATNDWSVGQTSRGDSTRDGALVSRFDVIFPTHGSVGDKSIMALMAADRNPSEHEKEGKKRMTNWVRTVQQVNYWIHRGIHLGAIKQVELAAVHAVISQFPMKLEPRTVERIVIMARQCCIVTAIMLHYAFDESPRKNEVALPQHLHELEQYLVITAEQAKFAMSLFEASICNRIEAPIAHALQKLAYRPDPDLGFNYVRVQGCESANQLADEILMHVADDQDVTRDLITQHLARLRQTHIVCRPYVPDVGATHGMAQQVGGVEQQFFAMRGLSFHLHCIKTKPQSYIPMEEALLKHCHIGTKGREITASCVQGHAHLLCVRENKHEMKPYTQNGIFMPEETAFILGQHAKATLEQEHRMYCTTEVSKPIEVDHLKQRGAYDPTFAARCAATCTQACYPNSYLNAYSKKRKLHSMQAQ